MSRGADPLRMMYVGILTTLLLLTGCFGLVEDDVIDSTSGEVTDQQFNDLQSRVSDLELDAAGHSTDIVSLQDRVTLIESNMITIADVMAAIPAGADMSDYLTSNDIASLIADAQLTAAEMAALEQRMSDLEDELEAIHTSNLSVGTTNYAPDIGLFDMNIVGDYYLGDANLTLLSEVYPEAANQMVDVSVTCHIFDFDGDDVSVGLDVDHDGVIDYPVSTTYNEYWQYHQCQSPITIANQHFKLSPSSSVAVLMAALIVEDESGAVSWNTDYESVGVTHWESWMVMISGIQFEIVDHPNNIQYSSYNSYDKLFNFGYSCDFYDDDGNPTGMTSDLCDEIVPVAFGTVPSYESYLLDYGYRIKLSVTIQEGPYTKSCTPEGVYWEEPWHGCYVSNGLSWDSNLATYTMVEGGADMSGITIRESGDMCSSNLYNFGVACTAIVTVNFEKYDPNYQGMMNPYTTLFQEEITVDIY